MTYDFGSDMDSFVNRLSNWDLYLVEYRRQCGITEELSDGVCKALLTQGAVEPLRTQLQVADPNLSYQDLRNMVEHFITTRATRHSAEHSSAPQGGASSTSAPPSAGERPVAMDVGALQEDDIDLVRLKDIDLVRLKGKGKGKQQHLDRPTWTQGAGQFAGNCLRGGQLGHRAVECPYLQSHRCGQDGHSAAHCIMDSWTEDDSMDWSLRCWCCHGWGHKENVCPSKGHGKGKSKGKVAVWTVGRPEEFPRAVPLASSGNSFEPFLDEKSAATAVQPDILPNDLAADPAWLFGLANEEMTDSDRFQ